MQGRPIRSGPKRALSAAAGTHLFSNGPPPEQKGLRQYITVTNCLFIARMLQLIVTMIITAFLVVIATKAVPLINKVKDSKQTTAIIVPVPIIDSIVQGLRPAISDNTIAARDRGLLISYAVFQVIMVCSSYLIQILPLLTVQLIVAYSTILTAIFTCTMHLILLIADLATIMISMVAWVLGIVTWSGTTCNAVVQTPYGPVNAVLDFGLRIGDFGKQVTAIFNDLCRMSKTLVGIEVFLWVTFLGTACLGIVSWRRRNQLLLTSGAEPQY